MAVVATTIENIIETTNIESTNIASTIIETVIIIMTIETTII